jgi:hypothetical protein
MRDEQSRGRSASNPRKREQGRYANFFQIGHNVAEFLLEFGQADGSIHTRVYVSPQHARILSELLVKTLRQHEKSFGPVAPPGPESPETDPD